MRSKTTNFCLEMKNVKENKNITKTREVVLKYFRFDNDRMQRKDALQDAETIFA